MLAPRTCIVLCIATVALAGCTDLSFLDDAITPAGQAAPAPELLPQADLAIPEPDEIAEEDPTDVLLARGSALQARANALR
jgi:hypothetical protein